MAASEATHHVSIVGAGIVGICCALRLAEDGHRVTVFDPKPPGTATSFGNAGVIGTGGIMPYSHPGLWKEIPGMLANPASPLALPWRHLHRAFPWLLRFLAAGGSRARVEQTAAHMAPLTGASERAHRRLITRHRLEPELLSPVGFLEVYRDARAFEETAFERELLARHDIRVDVLDADEIYQLEPGLAKGFEKALFRPDESFVSQPIALTRAYAEAFLSLGGEIRQETVRRFEIGPQGPRKLVTDLGMYPVDRLVVSSGAWSRALIRMLGSDAPLESERGYHVNLPWNEHVVLNRPVFVADEYYVMCPMRDGVRITSGAEFGGLELAPDFTRIHRIENLARRALPALYGDVDREWMGHRPCMPDSKPVISRSPHFERVLFAFGHGHLGLTLSAVTGEAISDLVAGRDCPIPLSPFRVDRF